MNNVQAYLFFDGRCEEALDFYKKAIGAEVQMLMRFKDSPEPPQAGSPGCGGAQWSPEKIMHSSFKVGGVEIMASDGEAKGSAEFKGFSLAITAKTAAEADKLFAALSEGGQVTMPMMPTFFSEKFGMLADKFGVNWMVLVDQPAN